MSIPETSVEGHAVPRFSIYIPFSNTLVETLKHCWIERITIATERIGGMAQILAKDGLIYQTVFDCRIPKGYEELHFIASFQKHTYGRFVVLRLAKPTDEKKKAEMNRKIRRNF